MINIDLAAGIVGSSLLGVIVVIVIVVVIFLIVVVFIIIIPCWSVFSLVGSAVILLLLLSACHIIVVLLGVHHIHRICLLSFQSKERWSQAVAAISFAMEHARLHVSAWKISIFKVPILKLEMGGLFWSS